MKKNILIMILLLCCKVNGIAQQGFSGKAIYESKVSIDETKFQSSGMTPEIQQSLVEQVKKSLEKIFVLDFDKTSSIYKEEEKLDAPASGNGMKIMMIGGANDSGVMFKNVKEKKYVNESEIMGKEFLIKDVLPDWKWEMGSETKKIGNYTCYKATSVQKNIENGKKEDGVKKILNIDDSEMPKEKQIIVWYTPEIPVSQGPGYYWGLPGLILEVNDGTTTTLCSIIILNPKNKEQIKEPSKGKVITQEAFDEIMMKKMEENMERFKGDEGANRIMIQR